MKLTVHEKSDEKLIFTLKDVTSAYANTLRRLMVGEVPTMAIEDVTFDKNDSILYDEILAHRLGLVVFKTDLESYNMTSVCQCEGAGCAQCQLKVTLSAEGPKTVYAKDLKSADPNVKPIYPNTVLVRLLEGQKLEFEAIATLGTGKEHSKWNPGLVWYYHDSTIKVDNKHKDFQKFKDRYPPQIFNKNGEIEKGRISTPQLIDAVMDVNPEIVDVSLDRSAFVFHVESFGAMPAQEIVTRALDVFDSQVKEFEGLVKKQL
ncbi:MAG: DNA-directed RNA polymerase subunit D [Candidatus Woesearchaeota archaeon]